VGGAAKKVVGIVGDDPLTCRILGILLEGAGSEVRAVEAAAVLEDPSASLGGWTWCSARCYSAADTGASFWAP
jgi:hypothetical protein